jgi:CheY-like chemotaxis protein
MRKDVVILVTEDNDGHFALTRKLLRRAGIENEIVRFIDGPQTLDFLIGSNTTEAERDKGRKYLLLLDIRMPGISGIEVLEIVKKHEQISEIPVIMVTTSGDHQIAEKCYSLGCEAHVVKPINESLIRIIERVGGHL